MNQYLARAARKVARLLVALADRAERGPRLAHVDELRPGDRIMVECVVLDEPDDAVAPGAHVYVKPVHWQGNNLWYWTRRQTSQPDPWIEVR